MLKFYNAALALQEIPGQISLAINISGCPWHCKGCHSPHLWKDEGEPLFTCFKKIEEYKDYISCVLFMGGDWNAFELTSTAGLVKVLYPNLKTALYTALDVDKVKPLLANFDYVKTGPYIEELGGLKSPKTNQALYKVTANSNEETGDEEYSLTKIHIPGGGISFE